MEAFGNLILDGSGAGFLGLNMPFSPDGKGSYMQSCGTGSRTYYILERSAGSWVTLTFPTLGRQSHSGTGFTW